MAVSFRRFVRWAGMTQEPIRRSGGLSDDELCNDRPCTCGAAVHDPVEHAKAAPGWRIALAQVQAKQAAADKP
jgi:hypothetical protein